VVTQFALLATAWGASFLFIKVGLRGLSPAQVVWARMMFGAAALGLLVVLQRRPVPRDARLWGHLTVVAVLLCIAPFLLFAWAEQHISSGLASILNATTPLLAMLLAAVALPEEKFTRPKTLGLLLGFAGVVTITGAWQGLDVGHDALAQLACLGATTCYGLAFVYLRRFVAHRGVPAVSQAFIQVFAGAVLMLIATPWVAITPIHLDPGVVSSMLILGVTGTGLAYVWNNNVVSAWGATNAASVTYLTPVAGVVLGALVLGEPLHWNQPVGAVLVILGILAAHRRLANRRSH
jgi:drug/metabolite transporter (DMT)-like permease